MVSRPVIKQVNCQTSSVHTGCPICPHYATVEKTAMTSISMAFPGIPGLARCLIGFLLSPVLEQNLWVQLAKVFYRHVAISM